MINLLNLAGVQSYGLIQDKENPGKWTLKVAGISKAKVALLQAAVNYEAPARFCIKVELYDTGGGIEPARPTV